MMQLELRNQNRRLFFSNEWNKKGKNQKQNPIYVQNTNALEIFFKNITTSNHFSAQYFVHSQVNQTKPAFVWHCFDGFLQALNYYLFLQKI
jgi:hypothetical protein